MKHHLIPQETNEIRCNKQEAKLNGHAGFEFYQRRDYGDNCLVECDAL
jgi:hypothetical protein